MSDQREDVATESLTALIRLARAVQGLTTLAARGSVEPTPAGETARLVDECNQCLQVVLCNGHFLETAQDSIPEQIVSRA